MLRSYYALHLATQVESAAGAAYSIPLNLIKAMSASDQDLSDFKRWEIAMPTAMRNTSKALRMLTQGGEHNKIGATTVPFSTDDPEQIGEAVALAMGFKPTRASQLWDRAAAKRELELFWNARKQILLMQAYQALIVQKDKEQYADVLKQIGQYNNDTFDKRHVIESKDLKGFISGMIKKVNETETGIGLPPDAAAQLDRIYPESKKIIEKKVK